MQVKQTEFMFQDMKILFSYKAKEVLLLFVIKLAIFTIELVRVQIKVVKKGGDVIRKLKVAKLQSKPWEIL